MSNSEDFIEIKIARCARSLEACKTPIGGEWEAPFSFVFSASPGEEWLEICKEYLRRASSNRGFEKLATGELRDDRLIFFCHPNQLQRYADKMKEIVAVTNREMRQLWAENGEHQARRREFEALIEFTLETVRL
jgi:hypothetical protein